ncbi:glycogen synthase GlgA [Caldithrix abyssi]
MRICLVSAEIAPFAKMGGLGDVSAALGKYLAKNGHDVRLVMPFYDTIDAPELNIRPVARARRILLKMGDKTYELDFFKTQLPGANADVYLVGCPPLYERGAVYTTDGDEHLRFAVLTRAAIELCKRLNWAPDIFHANDWHTALLPIYIKTIYGYDKIFQKSKTVLTLHNIGYQGIFPAETVNDLSLSAFYFWFDSQDLYRGKVNFLKNGIRHAHKITTVSPTYAREIQTETYGAGLEKLLRQRANDLLGILNGVDYQEWNPETDVFIPFHYSIKNLSGKKKNKEALLKKAGLSTRWLQQPMVSMISRLVEQKGIDLLMGAMEGLLRRFEFSLVVLGSGAIRYEQFFFSLQERFPERVKFFRGYDYALSHLIEAGADIFLMPSLYEPCGLNQIYSLKYGTVPVVRKTGGLADTVTLYDWQKQTGDGFVFEHYNTESFTWAVEYALTTFEHKTAWRKIMINGMKKDFSWEKQIKEYEKLYENLMQANDED